VTASKHAMELVEAIRPVMDSVVADVANATDRARGVTVDLAPPPAWQSWFPEGELEGDLLRAHRGDAEAVLRLARSLPRHLRADNRDHQRARRELRQRASEKEQRVKDLLAMEMAAALVTVLGEDKRPQAHRFGQQWLLDDDGHKTEEPPRDLPVDWYYRWVGDETFKAAVASLLDRPYFSSRGDDCLDRFQKRSLGAAEEDTIPDTQDDPLILLDQDKRDDLLAAIHRLASPQQLALLRLLADDPSVAEAARSLNMAESTVRVQLFRLRQKALRLCG
jgi:hypothetical protein